MYKFVEYNKDKFLGFFLEREGGGVEVHRV